MKTTVTEARKLGRAFYNLTNPTEEDRCRSLTGKGSEKDDLVFARLMDAGKLLTA